MASFQDLYLDAIMQQYAFPASYRDVLAWASDIGFDAASIADTALSWMSPQTIESILVDIQNGGDALYERLHAMFSQRANEIAWRQKITEWDNG